MWQNFITEILVLRLCPCTQPKLSVIRWLICDVWKLFLCNSTMYDLWLMAVLSFVYLATSIRFYNRWQVMKNIIHVIHVNIPIKINGAEEMIMFPYMYTCSKCNVQSSFKELIKTLCVYDSHTSLQSYCLIKGAISILFLPTRKGGQS